MSQKDEFGLNLLSLCAVCEPSIALSDSPESPLGDELQTKYNELSFTCALSYEQDVSCEQMSLELECVTSDLQLCCVYDETTDRSLDADRLDEAVVAHGTTAGVLVLSAFS